MSVLGKRHLHLKNNGIRKTFIAHIPYSVKRDCFAEKDFSRKLKMRKEAVSDHIHFPSSVFRVLSSEFSVPKLGTLNPELNHSSLDGSLT